MTQPSSRPLPATYSNFQRVRGTIDKRETKVKLFESIPNIHNQRLVALLNAFIRCFAKTGVGGSSVNGICNTDYPIEITIIREMMMQYDNNLECYLDDLDCYKLLNLIQMNKIEREFRMHNCKVDTFFDELVDIFKLQEFFNTGRVTINENKNTVKYFSIYE